MTQGRFVWHELMTKDVDKAKAFYSELLGWKIEPMQMGQMEYLKITAGDEDIGGLMAFEHEQAPSHWMAYVTVDDIDAACKQVSALKGHVCVPPTEIPPGRFSVIGDPSGATVSLLQMKQEPPEKTEMPAVNTFCWNEVLTDKPDEVKDFYAKIVGWQPSPSPMPAMDYTLFKRNDRDAAGLMKMPEGMPQSAWVHYILVEDCDATLARAQKLGATPMMPTKDIPNIGRFNAFSDPTGAATALFTGSNS